MRSPDVQSARDHLRVRSTRLMLTLRVTLSATVLWGLVSVPVNSQSAGWRPLVRAVAPAELGIPAQTPVESDDAPTTRRSTVTLVDLEDLAHKHHPALAIAAARLAAVEAQRTQAGLYPNPSLAYRGMEMGNMGTPGMQGAMLRQRFVTGRKRQLDVALADREVAEWRAWYQAQQLRVQGDVRRQFYATLVAQRTLELTGELAETARQLAQATQQLLNAHQATQDNLLQAEIRAEESQILWRNAEHQRRADWRRLTALAGVPQLPLARLSGGLTTDLPAYSWQQAEALVLGHHPRLAAAEARRERAELAIQRAIKEVVPDIDVSVMVQHMYPTDADTTSLIIGFPIPIWNQNQGQIARTRAELVQARNDIRRIRLEIRAQLADTYGRFAISQQAVQRYTERILPRARQSLELVRNGYRQGQVEYLTLNQSQQTFLRTNLAYLAALRQLRDTGALIESQLLHGSLANPE